MSQRVDSQPASEPGDPADPFSPARWAACLNDTVRRILDTTFLQAHADEGTLWIADAKSRALVPIFNTGPNAARFVGTFRQPFSAGLISMVLASEQPFVENEVPLNRLQSRRLDRKLNVQTQALLAVPFYALNLCCGVVSCVQLRESPRGKSTRKETAGGFKPADLIRLQRGAEQAGVLLGKRWSRRSRQNSSSD